MKSTHAETILVSDVLRARVRPDAGMTIVSLVAVGRELLWAAEVVPGWPVAGLGEAGESSVRDLDRILVGGWFEMSPNAGLPDRPGRPPAYMHGEAVRSPWRVVSVAADHIEAELDLASEPLSLRRRIEVDGSRLAVSSELQNRGVESRPVSPGEHPCFRRDVFGGGSLTVRGVALTAVAPPHSIPSRPDDSSGTAAVRLTDPTVTLRSEDGLEVVMNVDVDAHPHLGLWWNYSDADGFGPTSWDTIAVEPLTRFHSEVLLAPGETYASRTTLDIITTTLR